MMRFYIDYDPAEGAVTIDVACRTKSRRDLGTFIRAAQAIRDHIAREEAERQREVREARKLRAVKTDAA